MKLKRQAFQSFQGLGQKNFFVKVDWTFYVGVNK